ncbi:WD40/YVTN/BNR-like repeat-containing protein [Caulobacter hibisci]|nr:exo-alpha-sialidase [Caulobacter hibisci]
MKSVVGGAGLALLLAVSGPAASAAAAEAAPYAWTSVPYGAGGYVDGFVYHPREKGLLYARTDVGGAYRYDYAGKRWIPLLDHLPREDADLMGVLSLAVDPSDPNKLYAVCGLYLQDWARKGAVLRSDDRGATWKKTELPIHVGGNADGRGTGERLMVDPADPKTIYFGSNQDGLWRSTDGGASFSKLAASPAKAISLVIFAPKTGELYVGSADGKGGLFVSRDRGGSFQPVAGAPTQLPQRAAFGADGTLYVTFAEGDGQAAVNPSHAKGGSVRRRDPATGAWRDISPSKAGEGAQGGYSGVDVGPDGMLVVSTLDRWWPHDDVFVSRDGGASWSALSRQAGFSAEAYPWLAQSNPERKMGGWISALSVNPFDADEMIYGHGGGLWVSRNLTAAGGDAPVAFEARIDNLEEGAVTQLASPTGGPTLLAAMGDTGGAAWDDITRSPANGLFRPNTETNWSVDYAGQKPGFIVRTTNATKPNGVYSVDAGANWRPLPASPYKAPTEGQPWRGPGVIAVSAKGSALLWAPEKDAGYASLDGGKTWTASAGWPAGRDQALVPVADKVVERVFYVLDRVAGRILVSVDGGLTFTAIASGLPATQGWERAQLAVVPTRMRDLWIALPTGLVHSRDAGAPFKSVRKVDAAWSVSFGAPREKDGYPTVYLYGKVEGRGGLWRSDDEGGSWTRINDDAHQFGDIHGLAGDLLDYGVVYIAPHGRGVLVGRPPK